jgi:hypothetical protein
MPAISSFRMMLSLTTGVACGVGVDPVSAAEKRANASELVNHLPPTRQASSFTVRPSRACDPEVIHRQIVAGEVGRPSRPGGSFLAACPKAKVFSSSIRGMSFSLGCTLEGGLQTCFRMTF